MEFKHLLGRTGQHSDTHSKGQRSYGCFSSVIVTSPRGRVTSTTACSIILLCVYFQERTWAPIEAPLLDLTSTFWVKREATLSSWVKFHLKLTPFLFQKAIASSTNEPSNYKKVGKLHGHRGARQDPRERNYKNNILLQCDAELSPLKWKVHINYQPSCFFKVIKRSIFQPTDISFKWAYTPFSSFIWK